MLLRLVIINTLFQKMNKSKIIFLLIILFPFTTIGQEKAVNLAEKLIGIDGKTSEARILIQQAMSDSVTKHKAHTWFVAGNIEIGYFNNEYHKLTINPNDTRVDKTAMAQSILDAFSYYMKALPLDTILTKKGKVKTKYSKEIQRVVKDLYLNKHFLWSASIFNQQKRRYPDAYNAFTIQGDIPGLPLLRNDSEINSIPDSIRGLSYFNAGISAWTGGEPLIGARAFHQARSHNYLKSDVFNYEIACYQALAQADTLNINIAEQGMINAAKAGYETFGSVIPVFLHIYIRGLSSNGQYKTAIDILNTEIERAPNNHILYRNRAFVYDKANEDEKSVADYIIAAKSSNDFETLIEASRKIAMVGAKKIKEVNNTNPSAKEIKQDIIEDYLQWALEFAYKAKSINPDNPNTDVIIENITYDIESNRF